MTFEKREADIIVVGSGAGGMAAAVAAAAQNMRVIVLEQSPLVGGTTAISGGMVWIPANAKMRAAGTSDTLEAARLYLSQVMPPGSDGALLDAFLERGDEAIEFLEKHGAIALQPVMRYPDYYPEHAGSTAGGRVLESLPFDARVLGWHFMRLRPPMPEILLFGGMMIGRADIPHLRRMARSPRSTWHVAKLLVRHAIERMHASRGTTLLLGNALAGRLLHALLQRGVDVHTEVAVQALLNDGTRVCGVDATYRGKPVSLTARKAVILATGGFSHAAELRTRFLPSAAGSLSAAVGSRSVPCGAQLAEPTGAQMSTAGDRQAFWVPASTFTRADGSTGVYPHTVADRAKPGLIAINAAGERFTNEARSYHEFVRAQLRAGAVPAWLVCDRRFLWRYGLGRIKPFATSVQADIDSGYLKRAPTPAALAVLLGVSPNGLERTIAMFNSDSRHGVDTQFGRGNDIYQQHLGDPDHGPNPCVAAIEKAPFFAVEVLPADLGMAAGLVTDARARVIAANGAPIAGLYACGGDMQSVMNGSYPGPGITLGPALVFGYLAAMDAAGASTR